MSIRQRTFLRSNVFREKPSGAQEGRHTIEALMRCVCVWCRLGVVVVVVSNERLAGAVGEARRSVHNNVRDLDTFLANTKMQLRHLLTNSLEQTVDAIYNDLDGGCRSH